MGVGLAGCFWVPVFSLWALDIPDCTLLASLFTCFHGFFSVCFSDGIGMVTVDSFLMYPVCEDKNCHPGFTVSVCFIKLSLPH